MREVEARLKISAVDRTGRVLAGVGNKLDAVNRKTMMATRLQSEMFSRLGHLAAVALPAAAMYEMVRATDKAADFQEALFKIEKKSGATKEQMAALGNEIKSLFTDMPVKSIEEMATAFERGAAAGIPLDDLREFAKLTLMIADGWDTTAEDTANFMAGFNKGLGIPIDKMEAFASLINDLADSGIADEKDIADFLDRAGASLKNFGLTPEQIAAYGAAMLNIKIPAEVAARAMDTLSGKLLAPENLSPKSRTALTAVVGDLKSFSKLSGNEKLVRFMKSLQGMTNQRKASLLGALLGEGFDDEIMRVVSAYDEVERNQGMVAKHMANASHSVTQLYEKQQGLFNKQWQVLKNNIADVEQSFGERLLPMATKFVEEMNKGFKNQRDYEAGKQKTSGGDDALFANDREEFMKEWKKRGLEGYKLNSGNWRGFRMTGNRAFDQATRRIGSGEFKSYKDYFAWFNATYDPDGKYARQRGMYRWGEDPRAILNAAPSKFNVEDANPLAPIPGLRPSAAQLLADRLGAAYDQRGAYVPGKRGDDRTKFEPFKSLELQREGMGVDASPQFQNALKEMSALSQSLGDGGQKISDGGDDFKTKVQQAAQELATAISAAAAKLGNININVPGASLANANIGRQNPAAIAQPARLGHQ